MLEVLMSMMAIYLKFLLMLSITIASTFGFCVLILAIVSFSALFISYMKGH